jgi:hypothetical protein
MDVVLYCIHVYPVPKTEVELTVDPACCDEAAADDCVPPACVPVCCEVQPVQVTAMTTRMINPILMGAFIVHSCFKVLCSYSCLYPFFRTVFPEICCNHTRWIFQEVPAIRVVTEKGVTGKEKESRQIPDGEALLKKGFTRSRSPV